MAPRSPMGIVVQVLHASILLCRLGFRVKLYPQRCTTVSLHAQVREGDQAGAALQLVYCLGKGDFLTGPSLFAHIVKIDTWHRICRKRGSRSVNIQKCAHTFMFACNSPKCVRIRGTGSYNRYRKAPFQLANPKFCSQNGVIGLCESVQVCAKRCIYFEFCVMKSVFNYPRASTSTLVKWMQ